MQTDATLFERELTKLIETRITDLRINISSGSISDISEYKRMAGMIEGLRAAVELMPEASEKAQQRNR